MTDTLTSPKALTKRKTVKLMDIESIMTEHESCPQDFKTAVGRCARCGGDHKVIFFNKITRPILDNSTATVDETTQEITHAQLVYNYWALCPSIGEPIMMRRTEFTSEEDGRKVD